MQTIKSNTESERESAQRLHYIHVSVFSSNKIKLRICPIQTVSPVEALKNNS